MKAAKGLPETITGSQGSVGIRIPKSPFCDFIREQEKPFITTSVNLSGEKPATRVSEIPESIAGIIDYAIDSGVMDGPPSRVFDLTGKEMQIARW